MEHTLTATVGRPTGSRNASRIRTEGLVPAVVYGLDTEPTTITVSWSDLRRILSTEAGLNALITLDVAGRRDLTIVKDLQRDPVRREVLHVDFLRVDPDAAVEVEVPVVTLGEAKEVENARGIVDQSLKTLTVRAKPGNIPNELTVDIGDLTVGSTITVADVALPEGVTTDLPDDAVVVVGVATRFTAEEEGVEAEGAEGVEGAEGEAPAAEGGEGDGGG
jgi:large subunit ribosomal protein L25